MVNVFFQKIQILLVSLSVDGRGLSDNTKLKFSAENERCWCENFSGQPVGAVLSKTAITISNDASRSSVYTVRSVVSCSRVSVLQLLPCTEYYRLLSFYRTPENMGSDVEMDDASPRGAVIPEQPNGNAEQAQAAPQPEQAVEPRVVEKPGIVLQSNPQWQAEHGHKERDDAFVLMKLDACNFQQCWDIFNKAMEAGYIVKGEVMKLEWISEEELRVDCNSKDACRNFGEQGVVLVVGGRRVCSTR